MGNRMKIKNLSGRSSLERSLKNITLLSILALSCVAAGYMYVVSFGSNQVAPSKNVRRIAIFQPISHLAMDDIIQGFSDTIECSQEQYEMKIFNANGNKILMQAQAQEIASQHFDAIFTIGTGCSVAAKQACDKQQQQTPIICVAVDNPVLVGLSGSNVTGVIELTDYRKQIELVLTIAPAIRKIVLVYDISQGSGLEKDAIKVSGILQGHHVACQRVEIATISEIQAKVLGYLDGTDLIMILKDNTVVAGIDSLVKICQQYQIPLLATDLSSGEKGAALAFGIHEYDFGVQGAGLVRVILEQGAAPSAIPFTDVQNMKMVVNVAQAKLQGLPYDPAAFADNSDIICMQKGDRNA